MSEAALIQRIIQSGFPQGIKIKSEVRHATEVRVLNNKVDLVYFERNGNSIGSIFAIEAKLYDWKRALRQAYRNKLFANRVYVALPEKSASPAINRIHEFHQTSVGLLLVNDTCIKVYYNPPANTYRSLKHVEKVVRTLSYLIS